MAIDVARLPIEAAKLDDLTPHERDVLGLLRKELGSREIAERLRVSESDAYLVIAELLRALERVAPGVSARDIHERAGTRAASAAEIEQFPRAAGALRRRRRGMIARVVGRRAHTRPVRRAGVR